jgi:hypothetical protein
MLGTAISFRPIGTEKSIPQLFPQLFKGYYAKDQEIWKDFVIYWLPARNRDCFGNIGGIQCG